MTRINLIDPTELTLRHLIAEYRETLMVPAALRRTLKSKNGYRPEKIPKQFTLNAGHVLFFFDKLGYLRNRYQSLMLEMIDRGVNVDLNRSFPDDLPAKHYGSWTPSERDKNIIRERIALRISQKPHLYKDAHRSQNVSF